MADRKPTPKQRLALSLINDGVLDPTQVVEACDVQGGYDNEATFLYRLIDRGWVDLVLTEAGKEAMNRE